MAKEKAVKVCDSTPGISVDAPVKEKKTTTRRRTTKKDKDEA